jgi:hypothetical protein
MYFFVFLDSLCEYIPLKLTELSESELTTIPAIPFSLNPAAKKVGEHPLN